MFWVLVYVVIGLVVGWIWATSNSHQELSERIVYFILAFLFWPILLIARMVMGMAG